MGGGVRTDERDGVGRPGPDLRDAAHGEGRGGPPGDPMRFLSWANGGMCRHKEKKEVNPIASGPSRGGFTVARIGRIGRRELRPQRLQLSPTPHPLGRPAPPGTLPVQSSVGMCRWKRKESYLQERSRERFCKWQPPTRVGGGSPGSLALGARISPPPSPPPPSPSASVPSAHGGPPPRGGHRLARRSEFWRGDGRLRAP